MNAFDSTLKQRISEKIHKKDFMQLLLDALSDDEEKITKNDNIDLCDLETVNLEKKLTYNVIFKM